MICREMGTYLLIMFLSDTSAQTPVQQTLVDSTTMATWTYGDQQAWTTIPASECGREDMQSPVEISTSFSSTTEDELESTVEGKSLGPVVWKAKQPTLNVSMTTGPTGWKVNIVEPANVQVYETHYFVTTYKGHGYVLETIEFKSPSEHTVGEKHYAMEIQMNHYYRPDSGAVADTAERLVISVFLDVSPEADAKQFLAPIWKQAGKLSSGEAQASEEFTIGDAYPELMGQDRSFVLYDGTKTEPPCQSSTWMVMLRPQLLSEAQLNDFRGSLSSYSPSRLNPATSEIPAGIDSSLWNTAYISNNRAIQDLGSRQLQLIQQTNVPEGEGWRDWSPPVPFWDQWWSMMWIALGILTVGVIILLMLRRHHSKYRDHRGAFKSDGVCYDSSDDDIQGRAEAAFHKEAAFVNGSTYQVAQDHGRHHLRSTECCDGFHDDEDEFVMVPMQPMQMTPLPAEYTASTFPQQGFR